MPPAVVIEYPKEEANDRNPNRVRRWTISTDVPIDCVSHMAHVIGTVDVDSVPTPWEEHTHLQFFARGGGEEVTFGIAVLSLAGTGVDTFRHGVGKFCGRVAVGTGNHSKVFGKGTGVARFHVFPYVVGRRLANLVSCIRLGGPVVPKDGRMPVQTLVLLDVARELIDGRGHEVVVGNVGIGEEVGAVVGVDVIAEAGLGDDWIGTDMAGGKKVHFDGGRVDELNEAEVEAAADDAESQSSSNIGRCGVTGKKLHIYWIGCLDDGRGVRQPRKQARCWPCAESAAAAAPPQE